MEKNFDEWNKQKKILDNKENRILFKEGEVWWCSVGINVGHESCGKGLTFRRPVLILKKLSGSNCIGIPLSTQKKSGSWFVDISVQGQAVSALLYQIKMFSVNRFQRKLCTLDMRDRLRVKEKLKALLELSNYHQDVTPGSVGYPKA
jgi:mRNA interferase MazF